MKKICIVLMFFILLICSCYTRDVKDTYKIDNSINEIKTDDNNENLSLFEKEAEIQPITIAEPNNKEKKTSSLNSTENNIINAKPKSIYESNENIDMKIELVKTGFYEKKFYSPDYKNFILATIEGIDEQGNISYNIYLNNRKIYLDNADYMEFDNNSIKWLDKNRVLINGNYIYDLEFNEKREIDYSVLKDGNDNYEYYIKNSSINRSNNKIAYVFLKDSDEYIFIYDMITNEWKHVWNEFKLSDYYGFDVLWDKDNNLYFDSWGIFIGENRKIKEPKKIYIEIYKYNNNNESLELHLSDYNLHSASLDYNNILIESRESYFPNYYIYSFVEKKITHRFDEVFIDRKICWSNNSEYIAYYDEQLKTIYVYSLLSTRTYEKNISHIVGDSYLKELGAQDDGFIFFVGGYDMGHTYSIKTSNLMKKK